MLENSLKELEHFEKNKSKILVIDANDDIIENPELLQTWIKQIEDFVNSVYIRI